MVISRQDIESVYGPGTGAGDYQEIREMPREITVGTGYGPDRRSQWATALSEEDGQNATRVTLSGWFHDPAGDRKAA